MTKKIIIIEDDQETKVRCETRYYLRPCVNDRGEKSPITKETFELLEDPFDFKVYYFLYANIDTSNGTTRASYNLIKAKCKISKKKIIESVAKLCDMGLLEKLKVSEYGAPSSNRYIVYGIEEQKYGI